MDYKRIVVVVLDSVGVGELPDAKDYNDVGANTLGHIWEHNGGIKIPNLINLGVGNLLKDQDIPKVIPPKGYFTKLKEASLGKDTMTGHWEMMGLKVVNPFITFTDTGFPKELLDELSKASGRNIVGNKSASGTEIIDEYGEHQMKTGDLIVYTSADSVLQIAAHEEVIPVEELWDICKKARELTMKDEWKVGRIIARPYIGSGKGQFTRTSNRHDYAVKPFDQTALNHLKESGYDVISVGKINDIFDGEGITQSHPIKSNHHGMEVLDELLKEDSEGLIFVNLVDFDAMYGHRRNPKGYGECLEEFDQQLTGILDTLKEDDLLMITADHGTDPTYRGSDHTREYIPWLIYSKSLQGGGELPVGDTYACIGATIVQNFNAAPLKNGVSYLEQIL